MSSEIQRAFAALAEDAGRVRLAAAETVRERADRRLIRQAVTGVALVSVLVLVVAVGAWMFVAYSGKPAPVPAASATPAPSDPVAPSPSTSVPGSPSLSASSATAPPATQRPMPTSIPAWAFLQTSDVPGRAKAAPERIAQGDSWWLPRLCGADYDQRDRIGIRRTQEILFGSAGAPADATPDAAVYEDIIVYRGDGARVFMADLRAAVRACPSSKTDAGVTVRNYSRGTIGAGDESLLIEQTRPAFGDSGEPVGDGSLHHLYWAVVRIGDSVAFVSNTGWESASADRSDTVHLGRRAAARLAAWRA